MMPQPTHQKSARINVWMTSLSSTMMGHTPLPRACSRYLLPSRIYNARARTRTRVRGRAQIPVGLRLQSLYDTGRGEQPRA